MKCKPAEPDSLLTIWCFKLPTSSTSHKAKLQTLNTNTSSNTFKNNLETIKRSSIATAQCMVFRVKTDTTKGSEKIQERWNSAERKSVKPAIDCGLNGRLSEMRT